ncbi:MAG: hypothetical protein JXB48_23020 [Candidatus Latescibacteria bacterium]|nr:hypothetical protein [Candidatus Latescibacterota bacterium]
MSRIKIYDLPDDMEISGEKLKRIKGGTFDPVVTVDEDQKNCIDEKPNDWKRLASIVYGK